MKTSAKGRSVTLLVLGLLWTSLGYNDHALAQAGTGDNGITVTEPKQYPHRHLEKMIAELNAKLARIQAIDPAKVTQQIGTVQGLTKRSTQLTASAQELGLPGVTSELKPDESGALLPDKVTVQQGAVTPTPPTLGEPPTSTVTTPTFGLSAGDTLAEMVQLEYQIASLRILQLRSFNDRFFDDGTNQGSRVLALVGVSVSIVPDARHRNRAATVELTITPKDSSKSAPSLVALIPERNSYNAVGHDSKSSAFSGAALTGVFSLGFAGRWQSEQLYTYRDSDTLAFRKATEPGSNQLEFGWQFRPVLGRKSVDGGDRHLFAVLALDELDNADIEIFPFKVEARSYWRKYSSKHRASRGKPEDTWHSARAIEAPDEAKELPRWGDLILTNTRRLHNGLTPEITKVTTSSIGGDRLLVEVQGKNLHPAPTVQIGGRALQSGEILHRSDGSFQFSAAATEILLNELRVTGAEYGFSAPLQVVPEEAENTGLAVPHFTFGQTRKGNYRDLTILLTSADGCGHPNLHGRSVFVIFSGKVYELPATRWDPVGGCCHKQATVEVPITDVKVDSEIYVQVPFLGDRYQAASAFHQPSGVTRIEQLESRKNTNGVEELVWGLVGWGLAGYDEKQNPPKLFKPLQVATGTVVYAGKRYDTANGHLGIISPQMLTLTAPKDELTAQKKILVFLPSRLEPISLRAPSVPAPKKKPVVSGPPPPIASNTSASVLFRGEGVGEISKVTFEGTDLRIEKTKEGLRVFATRAVTKHKGTVELLGFWDEDKFVTLKLVVQ